MNTKITSKNQKNDTKKSNYLRKKRWKLRDLLRDQKIFFQNQRKEIKFIMEFFAFQIVLIWNLKKWNNLIASRKN